MIAMTVITTRSSIRVNPARLLADTEDLLNSRDACLDLPPPVLLEGGHALCLCELAERPGVRGPEECLADLLGDHQQLKDAGAPAIPGVPTRGAASAALKHETPHRLLCQQRD